MSASSTIVARWVSSSDTQRAKANRVLDPATRLARLTRDVVFDEGRGWAWDKAVHDGSATMLRDFTIEYAWTRGAEEAQGASSSTYGFSSPAPTSSPSPPHSPSPNLGELSNPSVVVGYPSVAAPTSLAPQLTSLTSTIS